LGQARAIYQALAERQKTDGRELRDLLSVLQHGEGTFERQDKIAEKTPAGPPL
jgi:hypothetical protein